MKDIETVNVRIYEISRPGSSQKYIGQTIRSLEQRLQEHREKPTNNKMKEFLKNKDVQIKLLTEHQFRKKDKRGMLDLEYEYIARYQPTLNGNGTEKKPKKEQQILSEPTRLRTVNITENRTAGGKGSLRINWTEDDAYKRKKCEFTVKSYTAQKAKAEAFRDELLRKLYGKGD
ncbi:MAG TPA: GIY-YIG nuclease family protein [Oculatellaceae cyanobacterium]